MHMLAFTEYSCSHLLNILQYFVYCKYRTRIVIILGFHLTDKVVATYVFYKYTLHTDRTSKWL